MHKQSNEKCVEKKCSEKAYVNPAQIGAVSQRRFIKKLAVLFFPIAISRRFLYIFSQLSWKTVKKKRIIV